MARWRTPSWQAIRDPLIVLTCLLLTIYETVFARTFHPELLIFFAGLIGAPLVIRQDEKRNLRRSDPAPPNDPDGSSPP